MVNVYDDDYCENIVARVKYNSDLDFWDGNNFTNGHTGCHSGLTVLRDGRYVLIHGTEWEGDSDSATIISKEMALQEILRRNNLELLEKGRFSELKKLYQEKYADNELEDD